MRVSSSFRDPSGYVFEEGGTYYRRVSEEYIPILQEFISSGLCNKLLEDKLLLPFQWKDDIIEPEQIPFISYPYEWSFSMLKDAALLTLKVQRIALEYSMTLKDASSYNIQFIKGKPFLIDHLSFYPYTDGTPWVAYRQFCQHFLNPLMLAAYTDISLTQLLKVFLDGIPAGLTWKLLPIRGKLTLKGFLHIKLNSLEREVKKVPRVSKLRLTSLIKSLYSVIESLNWKPRGIWNEYKLGTSYSIEASKSKYQIVSDFLAYTHPKLVWDLGANDGTYSNCISGPYVVAFDSDPACVELCYKKFGYRLLPLVMDLTNPSSGIGWDSKERMSLAERGPADLVLALALIHHLAIGNNLPLDRIAKFLSSICSSLVIEFVPKEDSQVQKMLKFREDIFPNYTKEGFKEEFSKYFEIVECKRVEDSLRSIYLMTGVNQ